MNQHTLKDACASQMARNNELMALNAKLLEALEAGNELWGWLPFDSGEDIQQTAQKVRDIQLAAIAEAKGE